jgi:hypothetical protein
MRRHCRSQQRSPVGKLGTLQFSLWKGIRTKFRVIITRTFELVMLREQQILCHYFATPGL